METLSEQDLNQGILIISQNIGLFNDRDKEKSCYRIFLELIKAKKYHKKLNSQELSLSSNLSRATVLHHIEKLISSGIVKETNHRFELTEKNLYLTILKLKKQMDDIYEEMKELSQKIDQALF